MKFIELTNRQNEKIYINPNYVIRVQEYEDSTNIEHLHGYESFVKETLDNVISLLESKND